MQLSVRETAALLNVSEKTIYRWAKKKRLPFFQMNGQYRFNRIEVLEWATESRVQVSPDIFGEEGNEVGTLPETSESLKAGGIFYRVAGKDVPSLLKEVVSLMRLPEEVDRDLLYQFMLAREGLGSTGIGNGIAIPHVRNPIVLHIPSPSITLCFLEQPVDFGSLDGQPVHTVFSIVSPTVRAHLHLLSRLVFCVRDKELLGALERQEGREAIIQAFVKAEASISPRPSESIKK